MMGMRLSFPLIVVWSRNIFKRMKLLPLLFILEEPQPFLCGPSLPSASRAITQQAVVLSAQQTRSTATVLLI
jgi:hypothetical protein